MNTVSGWQGWRAAAAGMVCTALVACGGGGGGDNDDDGQPTGETTYEVTLDPAAVQFEFQAGEGEAVDPARVTATATPSDEDAALPELTVLASWDNEGLDADLGQSTEGNVVTFQLRPKATLAPGSYHGTLRISLCTDPDCKNKLTEAPLEVGYTVLVTP